MTLSSTRQALLEALILAAMLTMSASVGAGQYETFDYYVQQMIVHAAANDLLSVQTFREQLENLRRPEPGDSQQAQPFGQQAREYLVRGNLKNALAAFRQAFIADPTDSDIAGGLALTYLRLNRLQEAERLTVYALSLAPAHSAHWLTLGQIYGHRGDSQRVAGAFINAGHFTQEPPHLIEQLRQLATTDDRDAVRIGALQALQILQTLSPTMVVSPAPDEATSTTPMPKSAAVSRSQGTSEESPRQRVYRRAVALTCLIVTFQNGKTANLGSGLLVSQDGLVITNNHVIEKAENLAVRCGDQESTAEVRQRSKTPDLALLATSLKVQESLMFNQTYNSDLVGLDVFVIGNPYGLEGTFSTGIISGLREIEGVRYIQISAPVSPGNSGGPVLLRDGTVIGIATMGSKVGQNLNFAIAAAEVVASRFFDPARMKSQRLSSKP
ncbi:MAG: trypsin-like peptidase domain-containing protein [Gammaproteobacteria bacterium]|nr:trypsin-like peptidase domain-containing protein [Gammaproteobacteria bacterium]MCP5196511.1 trypsin-like peptidase domain-containing protein [Gammaproteobacteria bacterium]